MNERRNCDSFIGAQVVVRSVHKAEAIFVIPEKLMSMHGEFGFHDECAKKL